jgi:hypothetical protein
MSTAKDWQALTTKYHCGVWFAHRTCHEGTKFMLCFLSGIVGDGLERRIRDLDAAY